MLDVIKSLLCHDTMMTDKLLPQAFQSVKKQLVHFIVCKDFLLFYFISPQPNRASHMVILARKSTNITSLHLEEELK